MKANIPRLHATLEAVRASSGHFNQSLWVTPPKSKKYPETCGCFYWYAVELFGTPEQKKRFTWDRYGGWVGRDILGLARREGEAISWAENTVDDIEKVIFRIENTKEIG
jgi:hypothetical protein